VTARLSSTRFTSAYSSDVGVTTPTMRVEPGTARYVSLYVAPPSWNVVAPEGLESIALTASRHDVEPAAAAIGNSAVSGFAGMPCWVLKTSSSGWTSSLPDRSSNTL